MVELRESFSVSNGLPVASDLCLDQRWVSHAFMASLMNGIDE